MSVPDPKQEFLQRWQVVDWLLAREYSRSQIRTLFDARVIVGKPFLEWMQTKGKAEGGRRKAEVKNGSKTKHAGRPMGAKSNYYRKSQVKEALNL